VAEIFPGAPITRIPGSYPVILATGGFAASQPLVRKHITREVEHLALRSNAWSAGDGLRLGLRAGGRLSAGMDEFWGRAMAAPPAAVEPATFRPLAQFYGRHARITNAYEEEYEARTWSEIDVAQWIARQRRARAWFHVPDERLGERVRHRTVGEMIEAARAAGTSVERRGGETVVEVVAGITTTLGGLAIDTRARAAEGVFVAGADAGGISTGGWASGLASALVLGLVAAENAVGS